MAVEDQDDVLRAVQKGPGVQAGDVVEGAADGAVADIAPGGVVVSGGDGFVDARGGVAGGDAVGAAEDAAV